MPEREHATRNPKDHAFPEEFHKFLRQTCFVCIVSSNLYHILFTVLFPRQLPFFGSPSRALVSLPYPYPFYNSFPVVCTKHFRSTCNQETNFDGAGNIRRALRLTSIVCVHACMDVCMYLSVFGRRFWHTGQYSIEAVVKFYTRCLCAFVTEWQKFSQSGKRTTTTETASKTPKTKKKESRRTRRSNNTHFSPLKIQMKKKYANKNHKRSLQFGCVKIKSKHMHLLIR